MSSKKHKGLLGAMLDGVSVFSTRTPADSEYTFTSNKTDPERSESRRLQQRAISWGMSIDDVSVLSDQTPNPENGKPCDPLLLMDLDDGSLGEVLSEKGNANSSWDPCDDIWDDEQDKIVRKVEKAREVAPKRTGKELWQIVRDNRRILIGKSLRLEDVIMMAKRPWRKEPLKFSDRVAGAPEQGKKENIAKPKEADSTSEKKSSKSSKEKKEKKKKKSRSSEKDSKSERKSKTNEQKSKHSVTNSSISRVKKRGQPTKHYPLSCIKRGGTQT